MKKITKKDKKICLLILFVLFLGFGKTLLPPIIKLLPGEGYKALMPLAFISYFLTPKASMIISFYIFMIYASKRFFDSIEMLYVVVFGGLLALGYFYNVKFTDKAYLFPITAVIAVPQLANVLVYAIFKEK